MLFHNQAINWRIRATIMRIFIISLLVLLVTGLPAQDYRTFHLKTGDKITGEIVAFDTSKNEITIQTVYGIIRINRDQLKEEAVTIFMESGDQLKGILISEDVAEVKIESQLGVLTINKKLISRIDYGYRQPSGKIIQSSDKFSLADERQIDIFYDPTGYTLDKGILYVSGLSWGFGLSDKLQITSRWASYFNGNFNLRPKLRLLRYGTLEKEHVIAVGAHFHSRATVDKYEWIEDNFLFEKGHWDNNSDTWIKTGDTTVYYGGYERIGTTIDVSENDRRINDQYEEDGYFWFDTEPPDPVVYYEAFIAYTYSRARPGGAGRISHTLGTIIGKHPAKSELLTRIYYGGAIDIRKNLIMNYELFYDPWYIEWWNRADDIFGFDDELSLTKPEKPQVSPLHFDLGFIYSVTDWLRLGIHFQPYIFAIYLKF